MLRTQHMNKHSLRSQIIFGISAGGIPKRAAFHNQGVLGFFCKRSNRTQTQPVYLHSISSPPHPDCRTNNQQPRGCPLGPLPPRPSCVPSLPAPALHRKRRAMSSSVGRRRPSSSCRSASALMGQAPVSPPQNLAWRQGLKLTFK